MRLLAFCPRIRKESGRVVATTAWRVRLLFLGMLYRRVVIDPTKKRVFVTSRYLWLMRLRRTFRFSDVQAVTYGYEDLSLGASISYAHDSYDWFTVGLRLYDKSEFRLFNFIGDGTFDNIGPFPDWMYWEDFALDLSGSQEKESRVFADVLSRLIGVAIAPPTTY